MSQIEGITMPYTMEDFERDKARQHIHRLPPEERLAGLTEEEQNRLLNEL